MTDVEITAAMVTDVAAVSTSTAELAAAYLTHRLSGLRWVDASREAGISPESGSRYEKLLPAICRRHELPYPPKRDHAALTRDWAASAVSGAHQTHHVGRGVTGPDCPLCQGGTP